MSDLWRRLTYLFRRQQFDRELEEEMRLHIDILGSQHKFGNPTLLKEVSREIWGWCSLETLLQDLRFGARILVKSPAFTLFAVLALGLGIGANTAVFSVVHAVLLRPLPFHDPGRLVMVWESLRTSGGRNAVAPANYADWRTQNSVFEDMAAVRNQTLNLSGSGEPVQLDANFVTANLFSVLGVRPILGRIFTTEEDRPGGPRVALISHRIWRQNFGGDPALPGKTVLLDADPYTVLGVMPPGFHFPEEGDVWAPAALGSRALSVRWDHYLRVVGRLKRGVSVGQANAELAGIAARLEREYPDTNKDAGASLVPLRDQLVGNARLSLLVLLVAVGCVLLIACANVSNLLLARASGRRREMAVRAALGAGRLRLIRQVLTESVLLSMLGAALGLLLAKWGCGFLQAIIPRSLTNWQDLSLSMPVLLFAALVSVLTAVTFGLAPALRVSRDDLTAASKQGGRSGTGAGAGTRNSLVVAEVALALCLVITAGLLIQTLFRLEHVDTGFQPDHVLTMRTALPRGRSSKYNDLANRSAFYRSVLGRVQSLPGVIAAGYTTYLPLTNTGGGMPVLIEGRSADPSGGYGVSRRTISPDYPRAMGISLRAGRLLNDFDGPEAPPVALINETMARQCWPGVDPVGKRFKPAINLGESRWIAVAGVLGDIRQWNLDLEPRPEMYLSYLQPAGSFGYFAPRDLAIRTAQNPMSLAPAVRREIRAVDKDQPVSDVRTLEEVVAGKLTQRRVQSLVLASFAGLALVLAALGLYGVLAYAVAQRTREIGIRMALGADQKEILKTVVGDGMRLVVIGIVIGAAGALAATRLMQTLLFGVRSGDPLTFGVASFLLLAVGLAACYFPARRAARVDPMVALRYE